MADEQKVEGLLVVDADVTQADKKLEASGKKAESYKKKLQAELAEIRKQYDELRRSVEGNLNKVDEAVEKSASKAKKNPPGATAVPVGRRRTQEEREAEREARRQAQIEREEGWARNRQLKASEIERRRIIRESGWAENRERKTQAREAARNQREDERKELRNKKNAFLQQRALEVAQQRDLSKLRGVTNRMLLAPQDTQNQISNILNAPGAYTARMGMVNVGMTRTQAFATQLQAGGIAPPTALYLAGAGGRRPPGWGGGGGVTRRGGAFGAGGWGRRILSGLASGVGIGVSGMGAYAAVQGVRSLVESTQMATAYERQRVAAEGLAGSQSQLNALLEAYNQASGGAVDNVTALANVTRLLATGFAKTVPEAERFVRATRGASIALGRPQEEITQETQLAISNTSVKRLDQIGLGIEEVNARIEELRKTNSNWTREMAFHDAVLSVMEEKYGHLTETVQGQATGVERLGKAWRNLRLGIGQQAKGPVDAAAGGIASALDFSDNPKTVGAAGGLITALVRALLAGKGIDPNSVFEANSHQAFLQLSDDRQLNASTMAGSIRSRGRPLPRYDEAAMEGMRGLQSGLIAIEEQYHAERLSATEEYEQQRTSTIRNYEKQIAREAEDFAIRRARSNRDFNKNVADVIEDAAKRDEDMVEDYTKRVAEAREDSEKRISEMERDYQKEREKDVADHRDRLLKAAGQLDAIAVLEERKRWRREGADREEAHREQIQEARNALDEQLEDLRKAHVERLEEAREADRERLDDMREARAQQIADEDADRALQLQRAQEDHDDQLAELDRQHDLRMAQIEAQAAAEREAWQQEFEDFAIAHNIYIAGLTDKRKKQDELVERWFDRMVEEFEKRIARFEVNPAGGARMTVPGVEIPEYARGGRVSRTGPAILHAGEVVLSRGMLAGSQPAPAGVASAISNRSVVFQPGAIALYPLPGWDSEDMLDSLEDRIVEILDRT